MNLTKLKESLLKLKELNYKHREALEKLKFKLHELEDDIKSINKGFKV